jgi:hypothetical protein
MIPFVLFLWEDVFYLGFRKDAIHRLDKYTAPSVALRKIIIFNVKGHDSHCTTSLQKIHEIKIFFSAMIGVI